MPAREMSREDQAIARFAERDTKVAGGREKKPAQADLLVQLAHELFTFGHTTTVEPFALPIVGPRIAMIFRGSRDALRATLARAYRDTHGSTPRASALADAITELQGEALDARASEVHLRVAEHDGGVVLDLGRDEGQVVHVTPAGWKILEDSPVVFRRTALTGAFPIPEAGGSVDMLKALANVSDETWQLVVGWVVASYLPAIPHPVLMLGGEQGSGKTTLARILVALSDPSPAPVRSQPTDPEAWATAASGSWVVAIDNVSTIPSWWSDCICKAVTGDGVVRRKLYTDSELAVLSFKRAVMLTSIDAGALRGDLGDRILLADLEPIPESSRRSEAELHAYLGDNAPKLFGAILSIVSKVLERLSQVELTNLPRMADFARVLAAMDQTIGTQALKAYLGQRGRIVQEVLESDEVGGAILALAANTPMPWKGSASELLKAITPAGPRTHGWPPNPRALSARLARLAPALRQSGVLVQRNEGRRGHGGLWAVEKVIKQQPAQPAQPCATGKAEGGQAAVNVDRVAVGERCRVSAESESGGHGGSGGLSPPFSRDDEEEVA